jgi:hypothetical protein
MHILSTLYFDINPYTKIAFHYNQAYDTLQHVVSVCDHPPTMLPQYQMLSYHMQGLYP